MIDPRNRTTQEWTPKLMSMERRSLENPREVLD
jgi:hypothetical protein